MLTRVYFMFPRLQVLLWINFSISTYPLQRQLLKTGQVVASHMDLVDFQVQLHLCQDEFPLHPVSRVGEVELSYVILKGHQVANYINKGLAVPDPQWQLVLPLCLHGVVLVRSSLLVAIANAIYIVSFARVGGLFKLVSSDVKAGQVCVWN